jgi:hypothetical protein
LSQDHPNPVAAEYARWWAKLSKEEKKALIASGAFKAENPAEPPEGRDRINDNRFDFQRNEEESFNRVSLKAGAFILNRRLSNETIEEVQSQEEAVNQDPRIAQLDLAAIRLRAMLHFLLNGMDRSSDTNMRLNADVIRIVVGEGKPPKMGDLAKQHHITKAAVSLRCRKLLRQLGLPPSCFMRPEEEVTAMRVSSILRLEKIDLDEHSKKAQARNRRKPQPPRKESF